MYTSRTHIMLTGYKKPQFSVITLYSHSCAEDPHIQLIMLWVCYLWYLELVESLVDFFQVNMSMVRGKDSVIRQKQ